MKTQFLLALLLPLLAGPLESEQLLDVLTLTDGSRFTGILTEYSPSETLSLQALDGRQLTFPIEQIASVAQQPSPTPIAVRYIEVVFLKDGVIFRGSIVEQAPGSWILLRTANGLELRFGIEEIWKIVRARMLEGVAEEEGERQVEALKGRLQLRIRVEKGAAAAAAEGAEETQTAGTEEQIGRLKEEINSLMEELAQRLQTETRDRKVERVQANTDLLLEGQGWQSGANRILLKSYVPALPEQTRHSLFQKYKRQDHWKTFFLNLLPLGFGSWIQGDYLAAFLGEAGMIAGYILYNSGYDPILGTGGNVIKLQTNTLGYIGIGLAAASYGALLIEPFYFTSQWNRKLAEALDLPPR